MIYRLINVPLSKVNYKKELDKIHSIANINGYSVSLIECLVKKHIKRKYKNLSTSLIPEKNNYRIGFIVDNICFEKLSNALHKYNIRLIPNSKNKISSLLRSTKDKVPSFEKPGIYSVKCNTKNCNSI